MTVAVVVAVVAVGIFAIDPTELVAYVHLLFAVDTTVAAVAAVAVIDRIAYVLHQIVLGVVVLVHPLYVIFLL
jgi:hypothetical protein